MTYCVYWPLGVSLPTVALTDAKSSDSVHGVNLNAIAWATFCPAVKPVVLTTPTGSCEVVHPASYRFARWDGFGTGVPEPKPNCKKLEQEFLRLDHPETREHGKHRARGPMGKLPRRFSSGAQTAG